MLSVNELALEIFDNLADLAEEFNAVYHELDNGARIVDCGVSTRGGYAAGRAFTEICMGGLGEVNFRMNVPIEGPHVADKFLLDNVVTSGARFGMTGVRDFEPDRWLAEGDRVSVGELSFEILHCPGHSPGSVVFYNREMHFAHVGDVLFNGSVGRSDIPGGDHATLIKSIVEKLLPLGDDVGFICGHGPGSSIGQERMTNPFLTGAM